MTMHIQKIRSMAHTQGIITGRLNKIELIREIQLKEGNLDCYASDSAPRCQRDDCIWRTDCQQTLN